MRVAVYYRNSDVRLEQRPVPKIGPGEILVKVRASGVCGSDVLEWYRIKTAPRVLGHEIAGEVVEVGDGVKDFKAGDRVFAPHHVPCLSCHYCLNGNTTVCHTLHTTNFDPGGFAEFVRVPALNLPRGTVKLPAGMSFEDGVFIEPVACVVRGQRTLGVRPGLTMLILGSGFSGLLHLALAKATGISRVITTDVSDWRLNLARKLGATLSIKATDDVPGRVREVNDGRLADLVIICTGAVSAFDQAMAAVAPGGSVLCFATPEPGVNVSVPINDFWRNSITIKSSYACDPYDISLAVDLIAAHRFPIPDLITHRLPLEECQKAFDLVAHPGDSMKVMFKFD
jgi:L-iditol 2-dehydrogenase